MPSTVTVDSRSGDGQFRDKVVSVAVEDGKVRIEVEAPDVVFATGSGKATARLGCSRADFELSENEFRRLLDRGELTLSTQVGDAGRRASCVEGSSITVNLKVTRD
jgi:hypothetical protein